MNEKEIVNLRVFYNKRGRAKYISHLDVTRCMQRAVKRAGLPVWYTEGFNPHIYLTFALPLSLSYESESESMDFRLTRELPAGEVMERLNAALPPDMQVTAVRPPQHKPEEIVAAVYAVRLAVEGTDGEALLDRFLAFLESDKIEVEKRTKRGVKVVDIKPDCALLSCRAEGDGIALALRMAAGPGYNVNPTLLTGEFLRREGIPEADTQILRKAVLLADGSPFA